tara:strand:+ start:207 stop:884 length:678 start_codon:yes stop_codon:yes gene_type:complete
MKVIVLPEAYINNTTELNITNTYQAILNSSILEKYQEEILQYKDGCIFKLVNNNIENGIYIEEFISCSEFSAPKDTIYVSNMIYDKLLLSHGDISQKLEIEIYTPPQATDIVLQLSDISLLDGSIKERLEVIITKNYKFLKIGTVIDIDDKYVTVTKLEPYDICMVNNTDINVQFEYNHIADTASNTNSHSKIISDNVHNLDEETEDSPITIEELRKKRLAFFTK